MVALQAAQGGCGGSGSARRLVATSVEGVSTMSLHAREEIRADIKREVNFIHVSVRASNNVNMASTLPTLERAEPPSGATLWTGQGGMPHG